MIHRIYAELLKNYSSGHALYYPIPADKVRPGALGYFDGTGAWQSLANDVKSVEWPIPPFTGNLQTTADPAYQVDEFRSEGTLKVGGKFGLNASVPSTPVTAGLDVDGDRDVERVAVLKCGPIIKEYLQSGITDLKTWGKDSAKYILEREPLTRQYGFFIVTAMRKTNRCEILCTTKRNYKFSPSVSASVPAAGSLKASGHIDQDDKLTPGWIRRPVDNAVPQQDYIVFVEGYLFTSRVLGMGTQVYPSRIYREDEEEEIESAIENCGTVRIPGDRNRYDLECESWIGGGSD